MNDTEWGTIIPFLYEVTLDQDLAWRSPRYDIPVLVDDLGGDVGKDLSYGFYSLDDWIRRRRLERHGTV
jgi:hypothetical protein